MEGEHDSTPRKNYDFKRIDESSLVWQARNETLKTRPYRKPFAFGQLELNQIREMRKNSKLRSTDERAEDEEEINFLFASLRRQLADYYAYDPEYVDNEFFLHSADAIAYIDKNPETTFSDLFDSAKFTNKQFEAMLTSYHTRFEKNNKDIESYFREEIVPVFLDRLDQFSSKQGIAFDEKSIREKIDIVSVGLMDPIYDFIKEAGYASVSVHEETIRLHPFTPHHMLEKIFMHELLHVLAGRTVLYEQTRDIRPSSRITIQRSGLGYNPLLQFCNTEEKRLEAHTQFLWLDEAITEKLALELSESDENIYIEERRLFDILSEHVSKRTGVDLMNLAINAYFENYKTSADKKIPFWKSFNNALNKAFKPGFLAQLDRVIEKWKVENEEYYDAALLELRATKKGIAYVEDFIQKQKEEKISKAA